MRAALLSVLLVAALLAPQAVGLPGVRGEIVGQTTAATLQVFGNGSAIEGGIYRWNLACADCLVRIGILDAGVMVFQDGVLQELPPGAYEIREFRGLLAHSGGMAPFQVTLLGSGHVVAL